MTEDEVIKLAQEKGREMPTDPPGVEFFFLPRRVDCTC